MSIISRTPPWDSVPPISRAWSSMRARAPFSRNTKKSRWFRACRVNSTRKGASRDVLAPSRLCVPHHLRLRVCRVYTAALRFQQRERRYGPDARAGHDEGPTACSRTSDPALHRIAFDRLFWTGRDLGDRDRLLTQPPCDQLARG